MLHKAADYFVSKRESHREFHDLRKKTNNIMTRNCVHSEHSAHQKIIENKRNNIWMNHDYRVWCPLLIVVKVPVSNGSRAFIEFQTDIISNWNALLTVNCGFVRHTIIIQWFSLITLLRRICCGWALHSFKCKTNKYTSTATIINLNKSFLINQFCVHCWKLHSFQGFK